MTDERIQALESVGFQWVLQHRVDDLPGHTPPPKQISKKSTRDRQVQKDRLLGTGKKQSQKWYDNYVMLCDYKDKYGNCRVRAGKKKDSSYSKLGKVRVLSCCARRIIVLFNIFLCVSSLISCFCFHFY